MSPSLSPLARIAIIAAGAGFAGWALENVSAAAQNEPPRYSYHFPRLPFLPIYAAGGALVALLEPRLRNVSTAGRVVVYGATLTALEAVSGHLERRAGRKSWDYNGAVVDIPHTLLWVALGLAGEQAVKRLK